MEQLSCAPVKITLSVLPKVEYKAYDVPPVSLRIHINHLVKLLGFSAVVVCKVPPLPPPAPSSYKKIQLLLTLWSPTDPFQLFVICFKNTLPGQHHVLLTHSSGAFSFRTNSRVIYLVRSIFSLNYNRSSEINYIILFYP